MDGEGSLFPFAVLRAGFPPETVFDILQADATEETFHDKPRWVEPESTPCCLTATPASKLVFNTVLFIYFFGLSVSFVCSKETLRPSLFTCETKEYLLFSV